MANQTTISSTLCIKKSTNNHHILNPPKRAIPAHLGIHAKIIMKFRNSIAHKRCIIQQRNHHSQTPAKYISIGIFQEEHEMHKTRANPI